MSRIGKQPIALPSGVEVTVTGSHVAVKGKRGELSRTISPSIRVSVSDGVVLVERPSNSSLHRSMHGLTRTLVANMVEGVNTGFTKSLDLVGVGYRVAKQGEDVVLSLGYSHPIRYTPPAGISLEVPNPTSITVNGSDKEIVGQVAAKLRSFRKPEPYKGKGVMYKGEQIRRKAGKSGKAGKGK